MMYVAVPTLKFCQLSCGVECYCKSIRCVTYADKEETDTLSCNLKILRNYEEKIKCPLKYMMFSTVLSLVTTV